MQDREKVYVHCKDYSSFVNYKNADENKDRDCECIIDDIFLRGRWPAKIVVTEDAYLNSQHQQIMESVETHRELWKKELGTIEEKEELGEDSEKEDFYGV